MRIPFADESRIVSRPPRNLSPEKLEIANKEFDDLLKKNFAVPNETKWSSPICLVTYADKAPRLTGDFSGKNGINDLSLTLEANLPKIADILPVLSKAKYIATLDLPKAFWQVKRHPDDVKKASLSIPGRSISFTRAAFGLKNVPAFFQNLMVSFFADDIFIYIDGIIVCSEDFSDLPAKLRKILLKARDKRVRFGLRKCDFITYKSKIEILGCIFQNSQRSISPDRIKAICSLPRPKTLSEVRSFVGSINFIRDWIPNLASVLEPISNLLKKTNKIIWTAETEACFKEILKLISSNIPLNLPDAKATILISADASEVGVSGIIWEQIEDCLAGTPLIERKTRPLCFYSKKFTDSQKNWPTIQKELYAILATLTLSLLSSFILTKRFTLFCDHKNLSYLISAPEKNRIVTRWIPILANFEFELVHTAGEDNHFADLLSRCFSEPSVVNSSILMCSSTVPDAVEGRHMMVEDSRLSFPQTSHQPSGPVSNRASGATFQTSTRMMRQFDKDCEGLSREEQVQLFWDRKDAFMEAHEQQQKYIDALEAEIKESADEQLRLQLERDAAVALVEDKREDQDHYLRGNCLFFDEDGHMCQLPSTDSDDEFRIYMTDVPDHIDLTIGASYRLFPHLIRDTAEFLKITNSASTSAIIPVSSEDEDDLYEQFLGESPKDTRLFDNLGNELPGPWNPPININIKPRTDIPLAPPNFDHVGIHDNAGYYNPCTDSAHPDEGPFDIMIATLDDSRAIEPEIDEDNLFAERLTIDPLSHNPLSSSDSDLPEETSWTQIPESNGLVERRHRENCTLDDHLPQNSYVDALKQKTSTILNKWKEAENSSNLKKRSLSSRNSATNKKLIDDIHQGDFVLKLSEHPSKTHGKWTGPYLVEDVSFHPSNCLIRNLITGISVRCSLYHVKKCHTNHSENVLQAYAATDSEEVVIDKLIDHDLTSPQDPKYLVRWLDGTTTWEGRSVENTAAYYAYRRKYIDEPPQARGPATARANSKLDAAWKAQHHKSAAVVARNQHRVKTRNRTSH
ncbi:hypothetical protein GEMRC1_010877 [Eukaryota sp. GEM-RC1]